MLALSTRLFNILCCRSTEGGGGAGGEGVSAAGAAVAALHRAPRRPCRLLPLPHRRHSPNFPFLTIVWAIILPLTLAYQILNLVLKPIISPNPNFSLSSLRLPLRCPMSNYILFFTMIHSYPRVVTHLSSFFLTRVHSYSLGMKCAHL